MKITAPKAIAILLVSLLFSAPAPKAESLSGSQPPPAAAGVDWALGRLIDSVYVVGNRKVRDIAVLREMELRAGMQFDPVAFERDLRYIGDLSPFSSVSIVVEPVGEQRCNLHVTVTERPTILLKLIYPVVEYDFNKDRFKFGVKWRNRNFRKRLESLTVDAIRDSRENDNASLSWSTRWLGWRRIGVGVFTSYFRRGGELGRPAIVEQGRVGTAVSLPLNDSRIRPSQLLAGLSFTDNRVQELGRLPEDEELISPSLGYWFDSRDSPIKPRHGAYFLVNVLANRVLSGRDRTYYLLTNDVRLFRGLGEENVIALWSRLDYQFGEYPDYITAGLGGAGTLRGFSAGDRPGAHRWFQSAELRVSPWAKRFYRLPFVGISDFLLSLAFFIDTGIAWRDESDFTADRFHGGFGWGLRLYSPFQDVARFDIAYNTRGRARVYFSTGARF